MSFIITLLAAVFVFSAVIAIHEFGHFAVAKLCGVQVNEFSIGMGPVLLKKTQNGTQYSLRALPVGGFVALEGEESPESQQAEKGERPDAEPQTPPSCSDADGSPDGGAGNEEAPAQPVGKPLNEAAVWQRALIMAAGAFVQGSSIELSADGPAREPYTVYMQGGLTYESGKLGIMMAVSAMLDRQ